MISGIRNFVFFAISVLFLGSFFIAAPLMYADEASALAAINGAANSEAIGVLFADGPTTSDLGLTMTDYNALANKTPVSNAVFVGVPSYTTATDVKTVFDSIVATQKATELAAAKTVAYSALTTALGTYIEGNYTTENWIILIGHKTSGDSAVSKSARLALVENFRILFIGRMATVTSLSTNQTIPLSPTISGESTTATIPAPVSKTITSSGVVVVVIDIPQNTVITGPVSWTGVLNLPTIVVTPVAPTADAGTTATATQSIEVGFSDTPLTLSQAVKLTFAGQAGQLIGWSQLGVFHAITNVCDTNALDTLMNGGAALGNSECKINVDSDLVVWTKHFTTFTTYTQTAIPAPVRSGGGGRPIPTVLAISPAVPVTSVTSVTPATHPEQVLGATVFSFTRGLKLGFRNNDVKELQQRLALEGVYTGPVTGYYGKLTRAGVKALQAKYKLTQDGVFGPKTREALNK